MIQKIKYCVNLFCARQQAFKHFNKIIRYTSIHMQIIHKGFCRVSHAYKTNNSCFSNNWYVHMYIYVYIHLYRNTYFTIVLFPWKHIWTIRITTQQTLWKTIYGTFFFCISFSTWFFICKIITQFFIVFIKLENYENLISGVLFLIVQLALSSIKKNVLIIVILLAMLSVTYKYINTVKSKNWNLYRGCHIWSYSSFQKMFQINLFQEGGFYDGHESSLDGRGSEISRWALAGHT